MRKERKKRKCCICHTCFTPHPKAGDRQKTCNKPECRKKHKRHNNACWRLKNPDYDKDDYSRLKGWLVEHPGYLKQYREDHPEYVEKNREAQKLRDKKRKINLDIQAKLKRQPLEIIKESEKIPGNRHLDIQADLMLKPIEITLLFSDFVHLPCLDIQAGMDFFPHLSKNSAIKQGGGAYGCKMAH